MRFQTIKFMGLVETGEKDKLNNSITENVVLGQYPGRLTEWTPTDVEVYGREMTVSHQKLQTKAPADIVSKTKCVLVGDNEDPQDITSYIDGLRWRILHIERYRA